MCPQHFMCSKAAACMVLPGTTGPPRPRPSLKPTAHTHMLAGLVENHTYITLHKSCLCAATDALQPTQSCSSSGEAQPPALQLRPGLSALERQLVPAQQQEFGCLCIHLCPALVTASPVLGNGQPTTKHRFEASSAEGCSGWWWKSIVRVLV